MEKPNSKITYVAVNPLILLLAQKQFGVRGVWNGILLWQYLLERISHQCVAGRLHSPTVLPMLMSCCVEALCIFLYRETTSLLLAMASGTVNARCKVKLNYSEKSETLTSV